ncbi:GNAT family N-acetyltransferase [Streptococcus ictaluri]|uniref:Acetyltransferase, GNAT family n=1 Tax=Streptococcus ictaluri 707-05 TaxID=764299 RepID=G5K052_9STRE|nr:GNAT family N-acetyltransferase [Streptococcus ictaluri]EHI70731.1 acetyltransferase, GNAT family [Streptococcus ictaluri 707-05]
MSNHVVTIEEAKPSEARELLTLLKRLAQETDYISHTEAVLGANFEDIQAFIERSQSSFLDICLLLRVGEQLVGLLNIAADVNKSSKSGNLFMAILKDYQGHGLGQLLLELALDWANHSDLESLFLDVQVRNQVALHLYHKNGFHVINVKENGIKSKDGEEWDVYDMCKHVTK